MFFHVSLLHSDSASLSNFFYKFIIPLSHFTSSLFPLHVLLYFSLTSSLHLFNFFFHFLLTICLLPFTLDSRYMFRSTVSLSLLLVPLSLEVLTPLAFSTFSLLLSFTLLTFSPFFLLQFSLFLLHFSTKRKKTS